jgi:hypothetical protein
MLMPDVEDNVPLPAKATDAFPELTPAEELELRARTIKLISDLTGEPIVAGAQNAETAHELAKQMASDPHLRPDFSKYDNADIAFLAGLVAQCNVQLTDDLANYKNVVIVGLVNAYANAKDQKTKILALTKLGEIDGVDAFKKRSEVTHVVKPIEEIEKELLSIIENVEYRVLGDQNQLTAQDNASTAA